MTLIITISFIYRKKTTKAHFTKITLTLYNAQKALRSVTENLIRDHEDLKEEVTKLRKFVAFYIFQLICIINDYLCSCLDL